jgi:hypothetical protein
MRINSIAVSLDRNVSKGTNSETLSSASHSDNLRDNGLS